MLLLIGPTAQYLQVALFPDASLEILPHLYGHLNYRGISLAENKRTMPAIAGSLLPSPPNILIVRAGLNACQIDDDTVATMVEDAPMKRLMLLSMLALLPTVALAQQTIKVDCSAYHKNLDGLWTVIHENVIIFDGKPISITLTNACCFGADSKRLMLGQVNIINVVEKACF